MVSGLQRRVSPAGVLTWKIRVGVEAGTSALLAENNCCPPDPASGSFVIGFTAGEWLRIDPSA